MHDAGMDGLGVLLLLPAAQPPTSRGFGADFTSRSGSTHGRYPSLSC